MRLRKAISRYVMDETELVVNARLMRSRFVHVQPCPEQRHDRVRDGLHDEEIGALMV